jgi:hypothetical protein
MNNIKQCTKCHENKPREGFYSCKTTRDGLQSWCIDCAKALKPSGEEAPSTALARKLMRERGIPCFTGKIEGRPGYDLAAWACVRIEAKASILRKGYHYRWTLSLKQSKEGFDGLFFLIAKLPEGGERVFIVPSDVEWIADNYGTKKQQTISVALDSAHGNAKYWRLIKPYENAYHWIETYRIRASEAMKEAARKAQGEE